MYYAPTYFKHDLKVYYRRIDADDNCEQARILRKGEFADAVYSMFYILSGNCELFFDGKMHRVGGNSFMLFDLKQRVSFHFSSESFCEYIFIQIHPSLIDAVEDTQFLRPFSDDYRKSETILNIKNENSDFESVKCALNNIVLAIKMSLSREHILPRIKSIISDLCIYYDKKYFPGTLETDSISVKVMNYINRNCFENITYKIISDKFYISNWKTNEILRSYTGMSLKQYVTKIRLDEAKHLLEKTDFDANKIRKLCGFNSYTAFFRAYKKAFGDLPSNRDIKQPKDNMQ